MMYVGVAVVISRELSGEVLAEIPLPTRFPLAIDAAAEALTTPAHLVGKEIMIPGLYVRKALCAQRS